MTWPTLGQEPATFSPTRWLLHPGEMLDWMRAKLQAFYTLPARISQLRLAAAELVKRANEQGKPDLAAVAQSADNRLATTAVNQFSVQSRISSFLSDLGKLGIRLPGLGQTPNSQLGIVPAIPIALIIAGGAVAVAVVSIFADYERQRSILANVAKGVMSPEEASRLIESGKLFSFNLGSAFKPLILVGGIGALIYFWPKLKRLGRGRRRAFA